MSRSAPALAAVLVAGIGSLLAIAAPPDRMRRPLPPAAADPAPSCCGYVPPASAIPYDVPVMRVPGERLFVTVDTPARGSDAPVNAAPPPQPVAAVPRGNAILYDLARVRAAGELAKAKGISRREARAIVDRLSDAALHKAVAAAGLVAADPPAGDGVIDRLVAWIDDHGDFIAAIVKLILILLAA